MDPRRRSEEGWIRRGIARRSKAYWYRSKNLVFDRSRGFRNPTPTLVGEADTATLDLGCGPDPRNPFGAATVQGVDIVDFSDDRIKVADLAVEPIPFPDRSMDYVTAFDFFEHMPRLMYVNDQRRSPFIELMNEIHRVLRSGGILHAQTPAFPRSEAFGDPTHVNTISKSTVWYFTRETHRHLAEAYGFTGRFELVDQYWDRRWYYHLVWQLRAVH